MALDDWGSYWNTLRTGEPRETYRERSAMEAAKGEYEPVSGPLELQLGYLKDLYGKVQSPLSALAASDLQRNQGYGLQGLGIDMADIGAQRGIAGRTLANQLAALGLGGEDRALRLQGLGLDENLLRLLSGEAQRSELSDATGRGAVVSSGYRDRKKFLDDELALQLQKKGTERKRLGVEGKGDTLLAERHRIEFDDTNRGLDKLAAESGLNRQKIEEDLPAALKQLGLVLEGKDLENFIAQMGVKSEIGAMALNVGLKALELLPSMPGRPSVNWADVYQQNQTAQPTSPLQGVM